MFSCNYYKRISNFALVIYNFFFLCTHRFSSFGHWSKDRTTWKSYIFPFSIPSHSAMFHVETFPLPQFEKYFIFNGLDELSFKITLDVIWWYELSMISRMFELLLVKIATVAFSFNNLTVSLYSSSKFSVTANIKLILCSCNNLDNSANEA